MKKELEIAIKKIELSKHITAFTGAGISVASGIPPFRGKNGLWSKYNPIILDINYFHQNPRKSWQVIKEIFYDFFGQAYPNNAHLALAELEKEGYLKTIITQNIDNLHQNAGNTKVIEFHGTSHTLICEKCHVKYALSEIDLSEIPPLCSACKSILKPDFVFFGEPIPQKAFLAALNETKLSDIFMIIGSTGEIMPASSIPQAAKDNNIFIIEINTEPSNFTSSVTDLFLQGKTEDILPLIVAKLKK